MTRRLAVPMLLLGMPQRAAPGWASAGATHTEASWATRIDQSLADLLAPR